MAEPFKNLLNADLVRAASAHLVRFDAAFDAKAFVHQATTGLDTLEMKARALHICAALEATLPQDFDAAAALIERALAPAEATASIIEPGNQQSGLRGWMLWPVGEFVARRGLEHPERALNMLHALTQRFTAEFAIRPFLVHHRTLTLKRLEQWVSDPSQHVRRLVSEGSRPRLPWGLQLKALIKDPSPTLPLLLALQDDPSEYVRRSVANHLNDIAKDDPHVVAQWLRDHLPNAPLERRALLKHASRTLIKSGDAAVLQAWGLGAAFKGEAQLALTPQQVMVGGEVVLALQLRSISKRTQRLVVDYAVHHVKAHGGTTAKVFKGWQLELPPMGEVSLTKRHSMKLITTRRYHAGRHGITVHINGTTVAQAHFDLHLHKA